MKKPGRLAVWFLLFAGACFLLKESVELIRLRQVNEVFLVKEIEEKHRIMEAFNALALERQRLIHRHEEDVAKLVEKGYILEEPHEENASQKKDYVTLDRLTEPPADPDPIARERRDKVRGAAIHAWSSYEKYAWGFDALLPISKKGVDVFGGLGTTIIDSLDTLYIMGLHDEFVKATEWVSTNLDFNKKFSGGIFEKTGLFVGRIFETSTFTSLFLGGLISAYDLSGNPLFIKKAQELADRLLPAWDTPTGIPLTVIDLASGNASNPEFLGGESILADLGGEQVEMIALSQRTGIPKYGETAEKVVLKLREAFPAHGLLPTQIDPYNGQPTNEWTSELITMGEMGGCFYEYLLKVWVLGNKTDVVHHYRDMWERSMEGLTLLVRESNPSSYVYLAERFIYTSKSLHYGFGEKMDSVACFVPGMLALGADGASPEKAKQYLELADGLANTCYNFHMSTRTHLAGESYYFRDGEDMVVLRSVNLLRSKTIESLFYLWRKTGNAKYREWGWDIFQAFENHSRISTGYAIVPDVNAEGRKLDMECPSSFLAETLKYLYLLFSPSSVIPLDEWVFNTRGHPVRIVTRHQDGEYNGSQNNLGTTTIPIGRSTAEGDVLDLSGETEFHLNCELYRGGCFCIESLTNNIVDESHCE